MVGDDSVSTDTWNYCYRWQLAIILLRVKNTLVVDDEQIKNMVKNQYTSHKRGSPLVATAL